MLGQFSTYAVAKSFSERTIKISVVMLGDNGKFWVVNLATMAKLEKQGYEVA